MGGKKKENTYGKRGNTMAKQLLYQYLLSFLVFVFLVCAAAYAAFTFCESRIWYGSEPLYPVLKWIKKNLMQVICVISLTGAIALIYHFLSEPLRYLDAVVHAAGQLAHPGEEPVVLPEAMHFVEDELNLVREQALRNRMIAKEAEQRKNDLIVYLAHDLKTPLTSVIGYLTLLRDEQHISQELRTRYTSIALDKAEQLEELINEFFDITRFNLTTQMLEPERINLSLMLEQITNEFTPVLAEKKLRWRTLITPEVEILCDPDKLQRVFDNLIRNAVSYSYPDTEILLNMQPASGWIEISVCNHGKTIPPEKLARIFEQFFRVDSSRTSVTGGAGLGLAIAKEIVELHCGTIRVESEQESILFTIRLPERPG